jgi:hypothetical protein
MYRPQAALQPGNRGRRGSEASRRDFTFSKALIEGLFLRDQFGAVRLRGGAHLVENRLDIAALCFGQAKLCRKRQHVHRAGIAVQLGRLCHAHSLALAQSGNVLVRQSFDRALLLPGIGGIGGRRRSREHTGGKGQLENANFHGF